MPQKLLRHEILASQQKMLDYLHLLEVWNLEVVENVGRESLSPRNLRSLSKSKS